MPHNVSQPLQGVQRALLLFMARTAVRSRQHRNVLAAFLGLGLTLSLAFSKSLLYGDSRMYAGARELGFRPPRWYEPNAPVVAASFILLLLAILGMRTAFSLPLALKANWIFRITAVHSPSVYFAGVRNALFTLAAIPVWILAAAFYLLVWGGWDALGHVAVLAAVGFIAVNRSLVGFQKFPFACAYLPGEGNLRLKLPLCGSAFLLAAGIGAEIERGMLQTPARSALLFVILGTLVLLARQRWQRFAAAPFLQLQFDVKPNREVAPLELRNEEAYARSHCYLDLIHAPPEPSIRERVIVRARQATVSIAVVCLTGFVYEQVSVRLDPLPRRVGQSVDIGGRSLNYHCEGQGTPTVVFESGLGGRGEGWDRFQRESAKYTRACWYDRAGYGWSDAAPFPHPASAIAQDLHKLLKNAGIGPPYVMVGFSFGGICTRVYHQRYPGEVSGMVLVDSTHHDRREPILPLGGGYLPYFPSLLPNLGRALRPIGIVRLAMAKDQVTPFEPRTIVETLKEMSYESAIEARAVRDLGNMPLIVLTAGRHRVTPPENPVDARRQRVFERQWIEAQQQLALLSPRGEQRVFPEAGHNLMRDRPADVQDAIREVVEAARSAGSGGSK